MILLPSSAKPLPPLPPPSQSYPSAVYEEHAQLWSPPAARSSPMQNDVLPLPKGALSVPPPTPTFVDRLPYPAPDSPPSTSSQRLLDPDPSHVQFATYPDFTDKNPSAQVSPRVYGDKDPDWVPWPLRPYFWIPFVIILVVGAVGLEVALHFSNKNQGWPTKRDIGSETGVLHYVYTLPPVAVAAIVSALWTWTDFEIKKMQPYVDLVHGDSPPHRSLLLDYTRINNFIVWTKAAYNRHWLVVLASLMVLISLLFQPLSAALLSVKDTWLPLPDVTRENLGAIGLNQSAQFQDLTAFLTAAGFASASVLYSLPDPPFIHGQYTIAPFELPRDLASNGTVIANTTAVKSDSGCRPVQVSMIQSLDGSGSWHNSVNSNDCNISWVVEKTTENLFGVDLPQCNSGPISQFSPVIFWFFTYETTPPKASATFCFPTISLFDVNVSVELANGNLSQVTELRPFSSSSNFSSFSANVTGSPLFGRAYNGIQFNFTSSPDMFALERQNATRLQLPAAVFQAAVQSPQGLIGSFDAGKFVDLSAKVYTTYLTLIASSVYFLSDKEPLTMQLKTFQNRVWLSPIAVHILTADMLLLAICACLIHIYHRAERRRLRLRHEPGTIASAVSIGAQTSMGQLLAGRQGREEIREVLSNRKFRIDPRTMKIVMEGEEGYEFATSPMGRGRSVFAALQAQGARGRHFLASSSSRRPFVPNSPRSKDDV
ncbi:hypothetical protein J132_10903 [Termitomyces sp. J132]|nr:hypothetical protein H2248_011449 [Termitomyces sp. 'cryptogamus']KNZ76955.1 hypothetical protein J132_10903 [Termitomyces sp. J132]